KVERLVPIQPLHDGDPAPGFRAGRAEAQPAKVRVVGAKSAVEAIERVATRPLRIADARPPRARGVVHLELPPPHVEFAGDEVSVEVEILPALAERVLSGLPVRATGLGRLDAALEPDFADVVL